MTHVVHTKLIKSFGNFDLLLCIKKGIGELFTFSQRALNNLEAGDIAQEIGDTGIMAVRISRSRMGVLASLNCSKTVVLPCIAINEVALVDRSLQISDTNQEK